MFVSLLYLVVLLSSLSPAWASPLPDWDLDCFPVPGRVCPFKARSRNLQSVDTPLGMANGVSDKGATRFAVKYASAQRWQPSVMQSTWQLPNGSSNTSALPLPCPQFYLASSSMSEDCLSMVLYVPNNLGNSPDAPTFMWIHGGSYVVGSASDPGLDGSSFAVATGSIVAVIQYRLGALGFMVPDGQTNLAVKDVMVALQFLQNTVSSFGGDPNKITIAGESSGGDMARALLATESASQLFQSAIIQSDPMDYGFLSITTQQTLQNFFNGLIPCNSTDTPCLDSLSVQTILSAELYLFNNASSLDPSAGSAQPIRPVRDNTLITYTLDSTSPFPKVSKPVLLSTVLNEAATVIYGAFPSPIPVAEYDQVVAATFGQPRTSVLLNSTFYQVNGTTDPRVPLETMGTDQVWRCPTWTFSQGWVANGGSAYVGVYTVGATYPGNQAFPICMTPGVVCHQDDIEIVFGTVPNPTPAQSSLSKEMQTRYKAFMHNGNPNAPGVSNWPAATSSNSNAILLGSPGSAPMGACVSSFWGNAVPYDYQVYLI